MIRFSHFSRTDVGLVRSANEDNLGDLQTPNGHVFTVCDGMGGHVGGATASKIHSLKFSITCFFIWRIFLIVSLYIFLLLDN